MESPFWIFFDPEKRGVKKNVIPAKAPECKSVQ
jgi:hypothetical protein